MHRILHPPYFRPPTGEPSAGTWARFVATLLALQHPEHLPEIQLLDSAQELIRIGPRRCLCVWSHTGRSAELPDDLVQKSLRHMASRRRSDSPPPALCCNADPSDTQRARYRKIISDLELLTPRHWISECARFPAASDPWFRPIIPIPDTLWQAAATAANVRLRETRLTFLNWRKAITLQIAPKFCDPILQVAVSPLTTVDQLLETLIHLFKMPGSKTFEEDNCVVKLSWSLKYADQNALLDTPLQKLRITPETAVEVDARVLMRELHRQKENSLDVIYCADGTWQARSRSERFNTAETKFRTLLTNACSHALQQLTK